MIFKRGLDAGIAKQVANQLTIAIKTLVIGGQMNSKRLPAPQNRPPQAVPANRDTWFERPSYVRVLPEQFFDSRIKLAAVCPETALMYAVLEDAFLCLDERFETDQRFLARAREAEDWFSSDDSRWLFSFVSICEALGLDREYMRKKLKHRTSSRLTTAPAAS